MSISIVVNSGVVTWYRIEPSSRALAIPTSRNDKNASGSAGLGATWPRSVVVAGGTEICSVASYRMGSEVKSVGRVER